MMLATSEFVSRRKAVFISIQRSYSSPIYILFLLNFAFAAFLFLFLAELLNLRAEGGAKIVGVFCVKNHDFTPKDHIFSNFRGGARQVRPLDPPLITEHAHYLYRMSSNLRSIAYDLHYCRVARIIEDRRK
jgi:hypothetical protein